MGNGAHESKGLVGSVLPLLGSVIILGEKVPLLKYSVGAFVVAVFEAGFYSSLAGNSAFILPQH